MKYLKILILVALLICARSYAQGTCTPTAPCVPVAVTGVTGDTITLLKCGGTCTSTTLAAYIANPGASSPWSVVATFSQYAATAVYNDPEAYGSLWSYAAYETPSGGAATPVSGVVTFQIPAAPGVAPTLKAGPSLVTTGASGVQ